MHIAAQQEIAYHADTTAWTPCASAARVPRGGRALNAWWLSSTAKVNAGVWAVRAGAVVAARTGRAGREDRPRPQPQTLGRTIWQLNMAQTGRLRDWAGGRAASCILEPLVWQVGCVAGRGEQRSGLGRRAASGSGQPQRTRAGEQSGLELSATRGGPRPAAVVAVSGWGRELMGQWSGLSAAFQNRRVRGLAATSSDAQSLGRDSEPASQRASEAQQLVSRIGAPTGDGSSVAERRAQWAP